MKYINSVVLGWFLSIFLFMGLSVHSSSTFAEEGTEFNSWVVGNDRYSFDGTGFGDETTFNKSLGEAIDNSDNDDFSFGEEGFGNSTTYLESLEIFAREGFDINNDDFSFDGEGFGNNTTYLESLEKAVGGERVNEINQQAQALLNSKRNLVKKSAERLVAGRKVVSALTKEDKLVDFNELISSYESKHEKCENAIGHFSANQKKFSRDDVKKILSCKRGEMDVLWYKIT